MALHWKSPNEQFYWHWNIISPDTLDWVSARPWGLWKAPWVMLMCSQFWESLVYLLHHLVILQKQVFIATSKNIFVMIVTQLFSALSFPCCFWFCQPLPRLWSQSCKNEDSVTVQHGMPLLHKSIVLNLLSVCCCPPDQAYWWLAFGWGAGLLVQLGVNKAAVVSNACLRC